MNYCVYILFSEKLNKFYIGQTENMQQRIEKHNTPDPDRNDFTQKGIPWSLFLKIEGDNRLHIQKMERYIKKMKSKKYILKLQKHPDAVEELKEKCR